MVQIASVFQILSLLCVKGEEQQFFKPNLACFRRSYQKEISYAIKNIIPLPCLQEGSLMRPQI